MRKVEHERENLPNECQANADGLEPDGQGPRDGLDDIHEMCDPDGVWERENEELAADICVVAGEPVVCAGKCQGGGGGGSDSRARRRMP